ncbi:unnamed protein product [Haemonchus placei]|uniref:Secreted protein n=1 Tax=Haemonchus placei TaxID=6290 RepID=A0A0N4WA32_HAEPC|nr:unnamed protein product [Haemonchus placei]
MAPLPLRGRRRDYFLPIVAAAAKTSVANNHHERGRTKAAAVKLSEDLSFNWILFIIAAATPHLRLI